MEKNAAIPAKTYGFIQNLIKFVDECDNIYQKENSDKGSAKSIKKGEH